MKDELLRARLALWAKLKSNTRANRRAVVQAFKLVDKACKVMGLPALPRTAPPSNAQEVAYPATDEAKEIPEQKGGDVIATNADTDKTGPERPRRGRKPKEI